MKMTFAARDKILIANRGEISVRISRAAKELGIPSIAIYSHEDRFSDHHLAADEAYQVGGEGEVGPREAYLDAGRILAIAKRHGATMIHPGYGFLSEDANFARAAEEAGITFVGPPADILDGFGNKISARKLAHECYVPTIPGLDHPVETAWEVERFVAEYGFPVIVKASHGGGGRGQRIIHEQNRTDIDAILREARQEAKDSFGVDSVFLEKFLPSPKHIEVQILADKHGNVVHLLERDCTVQRKHQKIVELAPAVSIPEQVRYRMHDAAVRLAKHVRYENAATVEFLVQNDQFYFIEVNPRIQVEHTVTEEILDIDLVQAQIRIAKGASLLDPSLNIPTAPQPRGVAIQCRVTSEMPWMGFLPSCGTITYSELPAGPGIRLDGYNLFAGAEITPHYDPMLFKLIVRADDLASARTKMLAALGATHIEGVETNIYLLERILQDDRFVKQQYFTRSLDQDVVASKVKNNSDDVTAQRLLTFFAESLVNGTQIQGQIGKPGTFQQLEVPGLRRTLATADRHAANGKVANGYGSDGNGINGPIPNGHIPNGHTPNGHTPIGHAPNGHAPNGHAPNGHAPNGHTTNSDGHSRLTINGHGSVGHDIEGYNQDGWRGVLLAEGPKAFAARVRQHPRVLLTDTTWRDAQQSLLATRVRTVDLANIAPDTNIAFSKAYSLECWGGATFDVALRFLHEDPWKRLATLRRLVPDVPFQMLLRSVSGLAYSAVPQNFLRHFCRQAVKNGMDIIRVFDGLNDLTNLSVAIDACLSAGAVVEAAILYTGDMMDPACKYSLSYYLELVDHLVLTGAHIIAIKSMSGVWKPRAAFVLVSEIRKRHPDIPIHVHTHDAAGTGVATMLACVEAGADIIDGAIDSMSGTTSQPALSALIAGLADRDDEPEISLDHVRAIDSYWAQLRVLYAGFDAKLSGPDPDVYLHEIPGGQLTNLMFQARELGLGSQWKETKAAFVDANRLLGNIIKATPTSKAVGDLAQFMVNSDLAHDDVLARADTLDFPDSVLDFFEGLMGRPFDGFPEPLRTRVLARAGRTKSAKGQVSTCLEPVDLDAVKQQLRIKYGDSITETDVCSHVMFPDVFAQYRAYLGRFGDVSQLPSQQMLAPPKIGAEMKCPIPGGRGLTVQVLAVQPPAEGDEDSGERTVFFRVNGRYRQVTVRDLSVQNQKRRRPADPGVPSQIGSPFSGVISAIAKDAGSRVSKGDVIMSISAMKMIINVSAPFDGVLRDMDASVGESVERGDLLFVIAN